MSGRKGKAQLKGGSKGSRGGSGSQGLAPEPPVPDAAAVPEPGMSRAAKKRRLEKSKSESAGGGGGSGSGSGSGGGGSALAAAGASQESIKKKLQAISNYSIFAAPSEEVEIPECSASSAQKPYSLRDVLDTEDSVVFDASVRAATALSLLVHPMSRVDFYADYWQKKHLHLCREVPLNMKSIYTSKSLEKMLSKHVLQTPSEVVLGKYIDSQQLYFHDVKGEGEEDEDSAMSSADINAAIKQGFAYCLDCPQKYLDGVWKLLSCLEFEFGNAMRGSMTVSPAGCQAFGPTMIIGDSFFVQLEGSTVIQAFSPNHDYFNNTDDNEQSFSWPPAVDQHNVVLDAAELKANVRPVVNVTLHTGDSLYIPKGWVVECSGASFAERGVLLQVSTNHHNGVFDLAEVLYPQAMMAVELKGISGVNSATVACQSLPRSYLEVSSLIINICLSLSSQFDSHILI